jgi:tetratricopeptide (TPR) repeat protein
MLSAITVGERIVLHLVQYQKLIDSYDVPIDISQDGIAASLRISRAHAAIELKKLRGSGDVVEKLAHIKRGKTKRKVYFLSPAGEQKAARIKQYASNEGIDIGPLIDIRRCKAQELWQTLGSDSRKILANACVFRKPFRREALPSTTISLLPVDRFGMVDIPCELRRSVLKLVSNEDLRAYHSLAADYWLNVNDYGERLYHLVHAGRLMEAEILIANKDEKVLSSMDQVLLDAMLLMRSPSEHYRGKVRKAQAEASLMLGDLENCYRVCSEMESSTDASERMIGLLIRGKGLRKSNQLRESLDALLKAKAIGLKLDSATLECEIAHTLMLMGLNSESIGVLEKLAKQERSADPELIERIYYLLGRNYLQIKNGNEALHYLSKSLAITKEKDRKPWYQGMAEAYGLIGNPEKLREYDMKANPPKGWGVA